MTIAAVLCPVSAGFLAAQNTKPGTDDAFVQADRALARRLAYSSNFNRVLRLEEMEVGTTTSGAPHRMHELSST